MKTSHPPEKTPPAPAGPCVDASELADILLYLHRCFLNNLTHELASGNVSFPHFFLLGALNHGGALTMSQIAARMQHTTAAATGLVGRLETLGHLARTPSADDRRKVLVKITARGASLVDRIKGDMIHNLETTMSHLTASEQKAWLRIYRKIHRVVVQSQLSKCKS